MRETCVARAPARSARACEGVCVSVLYVGAGGETLQCLGSCISASSGDASSSGACLLRVHLTLHADMNSSRNWATGRFAQQSALKRATTRADRPEPFIHAPKARDEILLFFLMENGDRQKVLQHRLLAIYPDDLYFQRVVAWSRGAYISSPFHVSNAHWLKKGGLR